MSGFKPVSQPSSPQPSAYKPPRSQQKRIWRLLPPLMLNEWGFKPPALSQRVTTRLPGHISWDRLVSSHKRCRSTRQPLIPACLARRLSIRHGARTFPCLPIKGRLTTLRPASAAQRNSRREPSSGDASTPMPRLQIPPRLEKPTAQSPLRHGCFQASDLAILAQTGDRVVLRSHSTHVSSRIPNTHRSREPSLSLGW